MKWAILLLVLAVGAALAEEQQQEVEGKAEDRALLKSKVSLVAVASSFLGLVSSGFSVAAEIVIMIALIFLIVTLKKAKDDLDKDEYSYDYEYYHAPAYEHAGYESSGTSGSSYASGYSKRSLDLPSFLNAPIVQRLTEKIHNAIEQYSEMQQ
ncbi:uncharacterized protein LOC135107323 [Scylla paramamosain]|uniref:uncharacterized protein LOC135107323 n=1 Tax=Scylla paramamosain TaxID=85552 RepID=UPI003083CB6C